MRVLSAFIQSLNGLYLVVLVLLNVSMNTVLAQDMFSTTAKVSNASASAKKEALSAAMTDILVRVTGDANVSTNEALTELIENPNPYIRSIAYADSRTLAVAFSKAKLERVLKTKGVTYWRLDRAPVLFFLVIERAGNTSVLVADSAVRQINQTVKEIAVQRGLPVAHPVQENLNEVNLRASDVKGEFWDVLYKYTKQRGYNSYVATTLSVQRNGVIKSSRWRLNNNGYVTQLRVPANRSMNAVLKRGLFWVASQQSQTALSTQAQVKQSYTVLVSGVQSLKAYTNCLAWFKEARNVQSVSVGEIVSNHLLLDVHYKGSAASLKQWLENSNTLRIHTADAIVSGVNNVQLPNTDVRVEWVGR